MMILFTFFLFFLILLSHIYAGETSLSNGKGNDPFTSLYLHSK